MVMFWSNGIGVSTGPVVVPRRGVEQVGAGGQAPDAAGMQRAEAQRDLRVLRNRAFLIAIERVEGVVVEAGFVGAAEARRLLIGERRRAGAVAGVVTAKYCVAVAFVPMNPPMLLSVGTWP